MKKPKINNWINCLLISLLFVFLSATIDCKTTPADAIDFIGSAQKSLSTFMEETVPFDEELQHYEGDGGSIDLGVYTTDKIEKIVFSSIKIESNRVTEESVFIFPAEGYDLPVFWANMTRFPGVNILIFDFMPLQDLVMSQDYGIKYMEPLRETKAKVVDEILKFTIKDKALEFTSLAMYAYSPYKMIMRVCGLGAMRIDDVVEAYSQTYISHWDNAAMKEEGDSRDYSTQKLAVLRQLMRENDPGYPHMVKVFGEEKTQEIMDIIF